MAGLTVAVLTGWTSLILAATLTEQHAIVQTGTGGPEVLNYQTVPVLAPGENQVLIRTYAAAVNPVDWKMRLGSVGRRPLPAPLCGCSSAQWHPGTKHSGSGRCRRCRTARIRRDPSESGDKVFAMIGHGPVNGLNGAYSQFVIVPAANVLAKPAGFTFEQAAGSAPWA